MDRFFNYSFILDNILLVFSIQIYKPKEFLLPKQRMNYEHFVLWFIIGFYNKGKRLKKLFFCLHKEYTRQMKKKWS